MDGYDCEVDNDEYDMVITVRVIMAVAVTMIVMMMMLTVMFLTPLRIWLFS